MSSEATANSRARASIDRCAKRAGVTSAVLVTRHVAPAKVSRRRASRTESGSNRVMNSTSRVASNPWRASRAFRGADSTSMSLLRRKAISGMAVPFDAFHDT